MRSSDLRDLFFQKLNNPLTVPPKKALLLVSGGLDSIVLLYLYANWLKTTLANLADDALKLSDFLAVLHLDYGLRPKENLKEQAIIKNYCTSLKIPLHIVKAEGHPKKNLQNWARKKRLLAALQKSKTFGYQIILTAHHLDDLVETFLLKLLKGQGVSSLTSFGFKSVFSKIGGRGIVGEKTRRKTGEKIDRKIFLLRPLIDFEKKALENYAKENNLNYHFDTSNALNDYERNYLRNEILPALLSRFPHAKKNLLTSQSHIKTFKNFLFRFSTDDDIFQKYFIKDRRMIFSNNFFLKINDAEKKLVLHQYFSKQCPWKRFSKNDLEELSQKITHQIKNTTTGKKSSIILLENKKETFFFWENVIFPQSKKATANREFLWTVSNHPVKLFQEKMFPSFSLMIASGIEEEIEESFSLSFLPAKKESSNTDKLNNDKSGVDKLDADNQQKFVLGAFDFANKDYQFRLTRGVEEKSRILLAGKSVSLLKHLKNKKYPAIFRDRGWQLFVKKDKSWQTIAFFCFELLTISLLKQKVNNFGNAIKGFEKSKGEDFGEDFCNEAIICSDFLKSEFSHSNENVMQILLVKEKNYKG